jgi:hypothetical protein
MNDVVDAVAAFVNAHPTLTDSTAFGGAWLWLGRAPDDTAMPYGTVTAYSVTPSHDSGEAGTSHGSIDTGTFQLSIFSTSRANCGRLASLVRSTLSDAPLSFAGGQLMHLRPGPFRIDLDPDPGPDGQDVWQAVVMFDVMIDTTY